MARIPPLRLQDVAPFRALGDIAKEFDVKLTLFGGTASRIAMHLAYRPEHELDLFDLASFSSDIDLWHSGDKERTPQIKAAIQEHMPFASWCRWAIIDREAGERAARNRSLSTYVPLRSIAFRTHAPTQISAHALADIDARRVSFNRNPNFFSSELARSGSDVEIFGLLLVLNTLADMREVAGEGKLNQDLVPYARRWLFSSETERQFGVVRERPHLLTRLWHLLASNIAREDSQPYELMDELIHSGAMNMALEHLGVNPQAIVYNDLAISLSRPVSSGGFRVPELSPTVLTGTEAKQQFEELLASLGFRGSDAPRVDPAFDVVGFVREITVVAEPSGREGEGQDTIYFSDAEEEFLHLTWRPHPKIPLKPKGLTASVIPHTRSPIHESRIGLAVGGAFRNGRAWLRVDLSDIAVRGDRTEDSTASLLIFQVCDG